jgi:hypothetical protein
LPPSGAVIDLQGQGDSVLVRWFVDQRVDSLGPDWLTAVVLTQRDGKLATFLSHLDSALGREVEMVDDGVYPGSGFAPSITGALRASPGSPATRPC